jgi:topoisomerase-4 subunit A
MYKGFLDYASYVIFRACSSAIEDGFKPVQRRIHSLKELDDGRYNKR